MAHVFVYRFYEEVEPIEALATEEIDLISLPRKVFDSAPMGNGKTLKSPTSEDAEAVWIPGRDRGCSNELTSLIVPLFLPAFTPLILTSI